MESVKQWLEISSGFIDTGKYAEAINYCNKAIEADPNNSEAYEYRSMAKYMLLNIDEAMADINTAISLDKNNHKALCNRANLFAIRKELDAAKRDLQDASAIVPENHYYLVNLADVYIQTKEFEKAIALADKVINQDALDFYALYYKALAHSSLHEHQKAIDCYLHMRDHFPDNADIYNGLGFSQIYTGELDKAKKNFNKAIKLSEYYSYPWDNLGYVFYLEKNYEDALSLINKSIHLDPSNSWAYKNRALVYIATNDKAKAFTDLQHALELDYTKDYDEEVNEILAAYFKNYP